MKAIDFLLDQFGGKFERDEYGNGYLYNSCFDGMKPPNGCIEIDEDTYFVSKEICERWLEIDIIIADDGSAESIKWVYRPYYRMRGKPVSPEQAFDIIRRTDYFFEIAIDAIYDRDDFIGCTYFDNGLIANNPYGYGWIHVDGTVGSNATIGTYPEIKKLIFEWFRNLAAFPYLDLIIAVTRWDEVPPEIIGNENEKALFETESYDKKFYDAVRFGIYVHDKKIEILGRHDTIIRYKKYDGLYGNPREKFETDYYWRNKISQVDLAYLKRCIESYGLNADDEFSKIRKYIWELV